MKLTINTLNPKRIFRSSSFSRFSPKSRSVSRSDPQSLSSGSTASSSSEGSLKGGISGGGDSATPTTVLPWEYSHHELAQAFNLVNKEGGAAGISADDLALLLSRTVSDSESGNDFIALISDSDTGGAPDLREAFDIFDADGDGKISAEELLQVFTSIGDERCTLEDCRRMISGVDTDGDGFVCFEDFSRMMMMEQKENLQR